MMRAEVIELRSRRKALADPLQAAADRFRALSTYRATLRSIGGDGTRRVIRYLFSRPGWVRMEFVEPRAGMVLVHDPLARSVRVWPFGVDRAISMRFSPDSPLLRDPQGHRIDRSDAGALLDNVAVLRERGTMTVGDDAVIGGQRAVLLDVAGEHGATVQRVNRFRVWLSHDTLFPLKVESFGADGRAIESVDMSDAELGVELPGTLFDP